MKTIVYVSKEELKEAKFFRERQTPIRPNGMEETDESKRERRRFNRRINKELRLQGR